MRSVSDFLRKSWKTCLACFKHCKIILLHHVADYEITCRAWLSANTGVMKKQQYIHLSLILVRYLLPWSLSFVSVEPSHDLKTIKHIK